MKVISCITCPLIEGFKPEELTPQQNMGILKSCFEFYLNDCCNIFDGMTKQ